MKKRLLTTFLILFLTFAIALQVSQKAFAEHNPNVYWTDTETDHMIVSSISWPSWFSFTVQSLPIPETAVDNITRIKFVIPRNVSNNLVLFHFTTSSQPDGWSGTPDEFDATGWPGVIIFDARTSPGIAVNQVAGVLSPVLRRTISLQLSVRSIHSRFHRENSTSLALLND